jgi:hypothetical protein
VEKKPLRFKDFDTVDYTGTGDEELASKASRRKKIDNEEVQDEALSMQQRLARGRQMKKLKSKIALGRKRAMRKTANLETLKKRAKKAARNAVLKKMTKGMDKKDISLARRMDLEKRLEKKKGLIDKLARKLLPQVRRNEKERKSGGAKK